MALKRAHFRIYNVSRAVPFRFVGFGSFVSMAIVVGKKIHRNVYLLSVRFHGSFESLIIIVPIMSVPASGHCRATVDITATHVLINDMPAVLVARQQA
jgi:hypothetical protein